MSEGFIIWSFIIIEGLKNQNNYLNTIGEKSVNFFQDLFKFLQFDNF